MKKVLSFLFLSLFFSTLQAQQVPDFTMTDINGNSHSLYADYLDQGKTVFISVATTWNPWDSVWVNSGVMDEFHATYGNDAVVLFIEGDTNTPESDLYGGPNSTTDFVTGHDYVIIDDSEGIMLNEWGINFFPWVMIICSDGAGYTQSPSIPELMQDDDVFYGHFETADDIADKMFDLCGTGFDRSKITGIVYTDLNSDCDQTNDNGIPMRVVNIEGPNGSFYRVTDENGEFRSLADVGEYTVSVPNVNTLWEVCDNPQTYDFVTNEDSIYLDFGMQATMQCTDPVVEISAPFLVRCFDNNIYVHYCNEGTIPADDMTVTVELGEFLSVNSVSTTPTSINGQIYTFDIGTLDVFECGDIVFNVTVDCEVELGTVECYSAVIDPEQGCINSVAPLNDSEECQEIVGSFDPNDKRAFPYLGSDDYTIAPNEVIKYQVRFQNTGTFTAFNVEVIDTISPYMDLATFRMGTASHAYEVEIVDHRTLKVLFEDINLPDSTSNEPESHGFFTYYLNQMTDLPDGTKITNEAGIYFDFNDPVITNTTTHTVDYGFNSNNNIENSLGFAVNPNPASDYLTLTINDATIQNGNYSLTTLQGQEVIKGNFSSQSFEVSLNNISKGVYFILVYDNEGNTGVQKVIIQ